MKIDLNSYMPLDIQKNFKSNKEVEQKEGNFGDVFKSVISDANNLKKDSDSLTADFLAGKTDNIHEVMIAAQKADISMSFVLEVRNKIMEAYQEFSRMQL